MSMEYIRKTYGVPLHLHQLVREPGGAVFVVRSATHYIHATSIDTGKRYRFHPQTIEYKTPTGWHCPGEHV